jgi:hypothetical protein
MTQKQHNDERKVELLDLAAIMMQPSGKKLLVRLLERSGFFQSTFHENDRRHAFHEGERSMAVWLYNEMLQADVGHLNNMIRDRNNAR